MRLAPFVALLLMPALLACGREDGGLTDLPGDEPPDTSPPLPPPPPVTGTTYYVSPAGSDDNPGTLEAPFRGLEHATEGVARAGDEVVLCGGTYPMNEIWLRRDRGHGGAPNAYLTIRGYDGAATAECDAGEPVLQFQSRRFIIAADYIYISGLHFIMPWTLDISGAGHRVVGNTFSGPQPRFGAINAFLDDGIIAGNRIEITSSSGSTLDHGMYIHSGEGIVIRDNVVTGTTGYGIHVFEEAAGAGGIRDVVIERNIVTGSTLRSGIIVAGTVPIGDIAIRNNILAGNAGYGIIVRAGEGISILNNTLTGNGSGGILFNQAGGTVTPPESVEIENNIIDLPGEGQHVRAEIQVPGLRLATNLYWPQPLRLSSGLADAGAVVADPSFVDAGAGDYHLRPGSAAVDAGIELGSVGVDFEGTPRPQGPAYDIGADELDGS